MGADNNIQQAAQAAAQQAAQAAATAQAQPHSPEGGIPTTKSIMPSGDVSNDVETMMNAQPLPQNGEVTVPTAQNGMLLDDVSAPENKTDPAPIQSFDDAKALFAKMLDGEGEGTGDNGAIIDNNKNTFEGDPNPVPNQTIDDSPQFIDEDVLKQIALEKEQASLLNNLGQNLTQQGIQNVEPEGVGSDNIKQLLVDILSEIKQENIPNPDAVNPNEPLEPELDFESDEFYEKFSENPVATVKEMASKIAEKQIAQNKAEYQEMNNALQEKLKPLLTASQQLEERNQSVEAMKQFLQSGNGTYNDFNSYSQQIADIMRNEGLSFTDPRSFEIAYFKAKMPTMQQQLDTAKEQQGKTLADYMSDESSIAEMVSNPAIKKQVIESYLKELQQGGTPQVIGGGSALPVGSSKPKAETLKEAGKIFEAILK